MESARTHRPMSHYARRIRRGPKTSWKATVRPSQIEPFAGLDILAVEYGRRNYYTCCTSRWSSDCGLGRSGSPLLQRREIRDLVRILSFLFRERRRARGYG